MSEFATLDKETIKITFIGDISCDRPLLKAASGGIDRFNFAPVFNATKEFFLKSDYVCANFETVCVGINENYKDQYMLLSG